MAEKKIACVKVMRVANGYVVTPDHADGRFTPGTNDWHVAHVAHDSAELIGLITRLVGEPE